MTKRRFPKPPEGSWTEHFGLDTAPVSYEDSVSPAFYELEREAIFKRAWLNVGRVEQLPRAGSYFTKEIAAADASVVVVRGQDGEVRAFHNVCRHRGNKLVWNDEPHEETQGFCRQFTCRYHGWRYALDGSLAFVQQDSEFFDLGNTVGGRSSSPLIDRVLSDNRNSRPSESTPSCKTALPKKWVLSVCNVRT